jgi:BCD family chlorophyll transporter-like MFS transporter
MILKRIQLGLIHTAVAITLVPINSTLNRVMIKELAISATLVALLASLPYLISPIQVAIGSFADRNPILGFRRTPYIALGLLLCAAGVSLSPQAAYALGEGGWRGVALGLLAFGAWGMGYNLSTVSYLSLASEISGEKNRGRTIAVMFTLMILGIIGSAIGLSHMVNPYTPEAMQRAFWVIGLLALLMGGLGLAGVEKPAGVAWASPNDERQPWGKLIRAILENRQATHFFWYLVILLAAILGQDILLEPYGGEAFGLPVQATTRITSIWGGCFLAVLIVAGQLEKRASKKSIAKWGGAAALAGFILIASSGVANNLSMFYSGVILLGTGTGLSTVSNLSIMLEMISPGQVGLFMGAWGMANAFSRLVGSVLSGAVRDAAARLTGDAVLTYVVVFAIEAGMLVVSLAMLRRIDTRAFHENVRQTGLVERAALANEA